MPQIRLKSTSHAAMALLLLFVLVSWRKGVAAENAAPSMHLFYFFPRDAVLKMNKIKILQSAHASYFEVNAFDGGYSGFQQTPDFSYGTPNISIFSLWDLDTSRGVRSSVEFAGAGTVSSRFGGEGEGWKTVNSFRWQLGVWYTVVNRAWKADGLIHVANFVRNDENGSWIHTATLSRPDRGVFLGNYNDSFLENWDGINPARDGRFVRKAAFKDSWNLTVAGSWEKPTAVTCSVNGDSDRARNGIYHNSFNAYWDENEKAYIMQHGGNTTPSSGFNGGRLQTLRTQPDQPDAPAVDLPVFSITVSTQGRSASVKWQHDTRNIPQLGVAAKIIAASGNVVASVDRTDPSFREWLAGSSLPDGSYYCRANMVDIFGRTVEAQEKFFIIGSPDGHSIAPTITVQPSAQTVASGATANLSVTATGSAPLTFQWFKDGAAILGATSSALVLNGVTLNSAGSYSVRISNYGGTVMSNAAMLSLGPVGVQPNISLNPTSKSIMEGTEVILNVTATGTTPLAYQWIKNGQTIAGANAASFTINAATSADAGSYTVRVTNSIGAVTSSPALVTVVPGSALSNLSVRSSLTSGQTLIVGAVVSGPPKNVLVRAAGPALDQFGVAGAANPRLTLVGSELAPVRSIKDGVEIVAIPAASGVVLPADPSWQPLLETENGSQIFSAIRVFGSGRVAVLGHEGFLEITDGHNPRFFSNLLRWLANRERARVSFSTGHREWSRGTKLSPFLTADGFAVSTTPGLLSSLDADVLVIGNAWTGFSPDEITFLRSWVEQGGGVLVAGLGWSWGPNNGGASMENYPMTKIAAAFGIAWGTQTVTLGVRDVTGTQQIVPLPARSLDAIAFNDDWPNSLASVFSLVGAFPFATGSRDSAIYAPVTGAFTILGTTSTAGAILLEAYDASGGVSARLVNLSARNKVGLGSDALVGGFAISGTGSKQLLIRAVGPTLTQFGVSGALADPQLEVIDSAGRIIAENDNWGQSLNPTFSRVGAFPLGAGSKDAATLVNLSAGKTYTVRVSGVGATTGEALLEIYEVF